MTVKLDAPGQRKTSRKKTSTKSARTVEKKTREKSDAESPIPLEIKGETTKTSRKKTSTKNAKTSRKKTSTKSAETSRKKWDLPDEELVVLRLTSSRVVEAMRRNPAITREELVSELRVTLSGINWQIAKLQRDKVIRRVGGRKFGSWEVLI